MIRIFGDIIKEHKSNVIADIENMVVEMYFDGCNIPEADFASAKEELFEEYMAQMDVPCLCIDFCDDGLYIVPSENEESAVNLANDLFKQPVKSKNHSYRGNKNRTGSTLLPVLEILVTILSQEEITTLLRFFILLGALI